MKKFTSLLIGVSLALAGAAYAQQTEESPAAGGKKQGKEKTTQQAEPKTPKTQGATGEQGAEKGRKGKGANAPGATANEQGATGATTETGAGKGKGKGRAKMTGTESATGASGQTGMGATTETGAGAGKGKKGRGKAETATGATGTGAEAGAGATVAPTGKGMREKGKKGQADANAKASAAPTVATTGATGGTGAMGATGQTIATTGNMPAGGNVKVEKQKVEQVKQQTAQIKQQHVNFKAQPRPDNVQAVTFNQNYRISGAERWSGPQYEVFRTYHPEWHDQGWYHSHYGQVVLIAGGWYFLNRGYWYPAWGYDQSAAYYPYDGPIYVGHRAEPPDRVIADVQAELQAMGYYQGEVDGLLGPLTRQALTDYQADQGLQVTAVIDEPTLDSLGMS